MDYPKRNGLRQTPLKRTASLKTRTKLKPMSTKAKGELKVWLKVKQQRIDALAAKFGFAPCEFCFSNAGKFPQGHHLDRNRRNNVLENCRIVHTLCHTYIHDNNVRDVLSLL